MSPNNESTLRSQLLERSHTINQLQGEIATRSLALETLRQGMDTRLTDKNREIDELIKAREEVNENRRKLEQEKLILEIKVRSRSWKGRSSSVLEFRPFHQHSVNFVSRIGLSMTCNVHCFYYIVFDLDVVNMVQLEMINYRMLCTLWRLMSKDWW